MTSSAGLSPRWAGAGAHRWPLNGCAGPPLGGIGALDLSWRRFTEAVLRVGQSITSVVVSVDRENALIRLSTAATEHPELWACLKGLRPGEIVSGTIASIESFGVFVGGARAPAIRSSPASGS